jgi:predicted ATP-dependent endonuclease of OLD family
MKIKKLSLRNYKQFNDKVFDFCDDTGTPHDMILFVGNNGTGKSSILQSIAMVVSSAVKPYFAPSDLQYPGFKWENIQRGKLPVNILIDLTLDQIEIDATKQFSAALREKYPKRDFPPPGVAKEVQLSLDYSKNEVRSNSLKELLQTKGYQYAMQLSKFERNFDQLFKDVGSIYIYHEQRTAASIDTSKLIGREENGNGEHLTETIDEKIIKEVLFKWFVFHQNVSSSNSKRKFELREGQRDLFEELENRYRMLFKGRSFKGFAPKMSPDQFFDTEQDFWLFDGVNDYEFSEMSGGERAIFPMLIDFANRNINNSIIIIDEVELHLHPPLQQALIRALPLLGSNNQFIMTTHSDDVATLFPENQIIRL